MRGFKIRKGEILLPPVERERRAFDSRKGERSVKSTKGVKGEKREEPPNKVGGLTIH
jgi:hypothetical protein